MMRPLASALLLAGLVAGAVVAAQPFDPAADRRRAVGDWLVENVGEEDGGRIVRMIRATDDYSLEYHVAFWRGNGGPIDGVSMQRLGRLCGGGESRPDGGAVPPAREIRARLAESLARCDASPQAVDAALEGFDRAFALASLWALEAQASTAAEAAAIANYGADAETSMTSDGLTNEAMDLATNSTDDRCDVTSMNATQAIQAACPPR